MAWALPSVTLEDFAAAQAEIFHVFLVGCEIRDAGVELPHPDDRPLPPRCISLRSLSRMCAPLAPRRSLFRCHVVGLALLPNP